MKKLVVAGLALAWSALALGSPAAAQSGIPDEIADGMYITVEEVRNNSMDTFEFFAGPSGGPISQQQFVSADIPHSVLPNKPEKPLLEKLFGLLDADSNGQLTLSEWRSRINRDLEFADQNSDGRITLKELANARQNMSVGDTLGMIF